MHWRRTVESTGLPRSRAARLWLVAVLGFGVGDLLTTAVGLARPGVVEAGAVATPVLRGYGLVGLLTLKLLAFAVGYAVWVAVPRPHSLGVPLGLALVGVVVTVWNTLVILSAAAA
jgi:hypothetical protein